MSSVPRFCSECGTVVTDLKDQRRKVPQKNKAPNPPPRPPQGNANRNYTIYWLEPW